MTQPGSENTSDRLLDELARGLSQVSGRVFAASDGRIIGPGTTEILVAGHPEVSASERAAHIDIGFVLNRERSDSAIWDCTSGFGASAAEALSSAGHAWLRTTAPVILELLVGTSEFADHLSSAESGLSGRHVIHGATLGWGRGEGPGLLQQWWLEHPVLPELAPVLQRGHWPELAGLRVFFGSQGGQSTAQVLLNREPLAAAQDILLGLDWPRFDEPAYARAFILVTPEASVSDDNDPEGGLGGS